MNRPCRIHFHADSAPLLDQLPPRYQENANIFEFNGAMYLTILVQNAFPIDFAPSIIRTRVAGTKEEDPIDFFMESISHIEWFYGSVVPHPLTPRVRPSDRNAK